MTIKRTVRPNLTNYEVLELIQDELQQVERRIVNKVVFTVGCGVLCVCTAMALVITTQSGMARDYAAEAMKKAFLAERAVHVLDEASESLIFESPTKSGNVLIH